jgi:hypothetical protein
MPSREDVCFLAVSAAARGGWGADVAACGDACRSARGEAELWDGVAAASFGARRRTRLMHAAATGDGTSFTSAEIETCRRHMLARVSQAGLSLDLGPQAVLTTPRDFAAMFPSTGGALYGPASHGWAASFRRQGSRTRIPGLYCAGGSTHPGAGVPGVLSSSKVLERVLPDPKTKLPLPAPKSLASTSTAKRAA